MLGCPTSPHGSIRWKSSSKVLQSAVDADLIDQFFGDSNISKNGSHNPASGAVSPRGSPLPGRSADDSERAIVNAIAGGSPPRGEAPIAAPMAGAAAEGPLRVPSAKVDDLLDIASELITRRGSLDQPGRCDEGFRRARQVLSRALIASIDRFHDLGLSREAARRSRVATRKPMSPGLVRRLAEQAEDLAVLTETAKRLPSPCRTGRDAAQPAHVAALG